MTEQEVMEDAKYSHDEDEIKLKRYEKTIAEISAFCKNQKKKMYKNRNQIAMFNLIKIEKILNNKEDSNA